MKTDILGNDIKIDDILLVASIGGGTAAVIFFGLVLGFTAKGVKILKCEKTWNKIWELPLYNTPSNYIFNMDKVYNLGSLKDIGSKIPKTVEYIFNDK